MKYRLAVPDDLDELEKMAKEAIASFKARSINQWQKGEPSRRGIEEAISHSLVHVLEDGEKAVAMISIVPGPELSYSVIDGAWLNEEPYVAFHRVCVSEERKGQGLAGQLLGEAEQYALIHGFHNVRVDTHPDNHSMQRALEKSGYIFCGGLTLADGSEAGDKRIGYQKILG